jgi:hypothetical protein
MTIPSRVLAPVGLLTSPAALTVGCTHRHEASHKLEVSPEVRVALTSCFMERPLCNVLESSILLPCWHAILFFTWRILHKCQGRSCMTFCIPGCWPPSACGPSSSSWDLPAGHSCLRVGTWAVWVYMHWCCVPTTPASWPQWCWRRPWVGDRSHALTAQECLRHQCRHGARKAGTAARTQLELTDRKQQTQ